MTLAVGGGIGVLSFDFLKLRPFVILLSICMHQYV